MILSIDQLMVEVDSWKTASKTIIFTNGCFDLLHKGHTDILQKARSLGDVLIVGLNSDSSVHQLKGEGRPIESEKIRAENLLKLDSVSAVILFEDETPLQLIQAIRPDVLVKGGDYSMNDIVGGRDVSSWGGHVEIIPLTPGYSTTKKVIELKMEGLG